MATGEAVPSPLTQKILVVPVLSMSGLFVDIFFRAVAFEPHLATTYAPLPP